MKRMTCLALCATALTSIALPAVGEVALYQRGDDLTVCNDQSGYTNLRAGPSARDYPVTGTLPQSTPVRVVGVVYTPEDYVYYRVELGGPVAGTRRYGNIHQSALMPDCDLEPVYQRAIIALANELGRDNDVSVRDGVLAINANYDGTVLYLNNIPELRNIDALASQTELQSIDFGGTNVRNLDAIAGLQ